MQKIEHGLVSGTAFNQEIKPNTVVLKGIFAWACFASWCFASAAQAGLSHTAGASNLCFASQALAPSTYTLTITSTNGTVSRSPNAQSYPAGMSVILTAKPLFGYRFDGWTGDITGIDNPITVVMDQNKVIEAKFTSGYRGFVFSPKLVGKCPSKSSDPRLQLYDVKLLGNLAYVTDGTLGLQVIDVTTPTQPKLLRNKSSSRGKIGNRLQIVGDYLFETESFSRFNVFKLESLFSPTRIGATAVSEPFAISVSGGFAYVTTVRNGVQIIDLKDPANPQRIGSYPISTFAPGIQVSGQYAYVANDQG